MRTEAAVLAALALLAGGCGAQPSSAGDFDGEQRRVAEAVEALQTAGERREADRICGELLASSLRDSVAAGGSDCADEIEQTIDDTDSFKLDVEKVTVTGARATAEVVAEDEADGVRRTLQLVNERGRWRVSSLGS